MAHGRRRFMRLMHLAPLGAASAWSGCAASSSATRCPDLQGERIAELRGPPHAAVAEPEVPADASVPEAFAHLVGFCDGVSAPDANEYAARRAAVAQRLSAAGYRGLMVEAGVNLSYLTGVRWGQSERPLLFMLNAQGETAWAGPSFEHGTLSEKLVAQGVDLDAARVLTWDEQASPFEAFATGAGDLLAGKGQVALDPAMRLFAAQGLQAAFAKHELRGAWEFVDEVRLVKTPAELARLRRANEATKAALRAAAPLIVPGMREPDARALVQQAQSIAGLSGIWVLPLFGPNAAFPHGTAAGHELREGELVLVDTGGSLHGYQSDITRTWGVGEVPDPARRAWDAVLRAQSESLQLMRPGAKAGAVDARARKVIADLGYGEGYAQFTHRLGHGIGLQGHEAPYLRMDNARVLSAGMTMSNEPGIYIPGELGVRIEDIVAITKDNFEVFGPRPTSLDEPFGPRPEA